MTTNTTARANEPAPRAGFMHRMGIARLRAQSMFPGDGGIAARANLRVLGALGEEARDVHATSVGRYIELRGTVPTRDAFARAAEAAGATPQARGVLNFLTIR